MNLTVNGKDREAPAGSTVDDVVRQLAPDSGTVKLGTNLQVSLSNTMQDLAMGLLGAVALALVVAFRDADRRQAAEERSLK